MNEELKLCPFCGGRPELDHLSADSMEPFDDDYYVSCTKCEVQQIANYSETDAIARWNKRV